MRYGWLPDVPDRRDFAYSAPRPLLAALPKSVSLKRWCPAEIYDQGPLGSCTGQAIAAAIQFNRIKARQRPNWQPSALFIYYLEREMEGTIAVDAGAHIRDGIKCVAKFGVCAERTWPYLTEKFTFRPPATAFTEAERYQAIQYQRVAQTLNQLKGCLASEFPFVFGYSVYESFMAGEVTRRGEAPMPLPAEKLLGGHAVLAVGYDDEAERFLIRNSWGKGWGRRGYFTLPYAYLTDDDLAADFWTIRLIEA